MDNLCGYDRQNPVVTEAGRTTDYAGFWPRLLACMIDWVAGVAVIVIVLSLTVILFSPVNADRPDNLPPEVFYQLTGSLVLAFFLSLSTFQICCWWMESSKFQATLGKIIVGLAVTDLNGHRIGFGRAVVRNIGKCILGKFFLVGYLTIPLSARRQGLYDMLARTAVVRVRGR
ncbi:MAG: RDD family protein [Negativicutes bacterium]|nr:RDD family protein [Negativicutes bacterium]